MAGYVRQESYIDGDTIYDADSNNEFDALVAAFDNATGHAHDGSAAEGPVIGLIGDAGVAAPLNKIVVDSTNDRLGFFVDVASLPVEQIRIQDGAIVPVTDNDIDLGATALEFKDLYIDGIAYLDTIDLGGTQVTSVDTDLSSVSASDDTLASALAIKTYVDAQVTAQDLDAAADTGTIDVDLDSETLTIAGGTGITTSAAGTTITAAIDSTVATLTGSQTLTNKTLGATAFTGAITTSSTVDGRDVASDGTKLDGIEASADVTDTANVTAAGALMDSELTDIAAVKALDQGVATTDTPTFAGMSIEDDNLSIFDNLDNTKVVKFNASALTTATTRTLTVPDVDDTIVTLGATQTLTNKTVSGGSISGISSLGVSGNITVTGTVDGRDVAADGTKLDGVEALADVTDTANVTAAGALMDSELTDIASVKALNQGVATTDGPTFAGITSTAAVGVTGTVSASAINADGGLTATGQTANVAADEIVIDNTSSNGISMLTSTTGTSTIAYGDTVSAVAAKTEYNHSTGTMSHDAETDHVIEVAGNTIATFDDGGLVMSKMIHRVDNTGNLQIAGGDAGATGGHIKLYGGAAAFADRVDINADIIQFEDVGGTAWGRMTGADFLWGQTSTKTPGAGNTTAGAALRDLGSLYLNAGTVAALQLSRNTDGNVLLANVNGTQEGRLECTAASGLAFNNPSDRDLKENVTAAPDTGAIFDAIDIVSYDWIGKDTPRIRWGAIAQDVQPHMPEAVYQGTDAATDPWGVRSTEFIYPLVAEVKSLRSRVSDLEARLEALENK